MTVTILIGDVFERLATIEDASIDCVVTSPPYWGLRDYGVAGQIGMEPTLGEHVDVIVSVCEEIKRVLKPEGTFWLNYGDCYSTSGVKGTGGNGNKGNSGSLYQPFIAKSGLKPKDLCMIPNRIAIALQESGWWVRSEIIWHKSNPMPESATDRPACAHEKIFLLTKSARYCYDADAVKQPMAAASVARLAQDVDNQRGSDRANGGRKTNGPMKAVGAKGNSKTFRGGDYSNRSLGSRDSVGNKPNQTGMVNLRNVWTIATEAYKQAHFATFPPALIEPCIKAGCPKGGTVLDPFGGAGTTGLVADRLGHDSILIELNPEYAALAEQRISNDAGMFSTVKTEGKEDHGTENLTTQATAQGEDQTATEDNGNEDSTSGDSAES